MSKISNELLVVRLDFDSRLLLSYCANLIQKTIVVTSCHCNLHVSKQRPNYAQSLGSHRTKHEHALEITLQHGVDRRCLSAAFWKQARNSMALTDIPRHRHGISTHTYSLQTCLKMMMAFSAGHVAVPLNAARLQTIKQQDVIAVA